MNDARMEWSDYPAVMRVRELAEVLGVGLAAAYNLVHVRGFPAVVLGRNIRIDRDRAREWFLTSCQKVS